VTFSVTADNTTGAGQVSNPSTPVTPAAAPPAAAFSITPSTEHNVALYDGTASGAQVVRFSSDFNSSFSPTAMLDASAGSGIAPWATAGGQITNQYAIFSLAGGQSYLIDNVQIMPRPDYTSQSVKTFAIDVSNTTSDDSAFTQVLTGTVVNNGTLQIFTLPQPVTAKYIRYRPLSNYGDPNFISTEQLTVLTPQAGGNSVTLTDHSTSAGHTITGWNWDFGDGSTSTEQNPTHSYANPGSYTIALTVTDDLSDQTSVSQTYTAYAVNFPVASAPTNLQATPQNSAATLTWDPPTDTANLPVDSYDISSTTGFHLTVAATSPRSVQITPLSDGVTYTFSVRAHTASGLGAPSTIQVTPVGPPTAPGSPSHQPANGQLTFNWGQPNPDGGTIDYYTATLSQGATTIQTQQVTSRSATFSGLTNGVTYSFSVTAHNQYGSGPATTDSGVPSDVPGAPTGLTLIPGDGQLGVAWTAAQSFIPIQHYHIHVAGPSYTKDVDVTLPCSGSGCATGVAGLVNGLTYTFTISATNSAGTGQSASISGSPAAVTTNLQPATVFYITERGAQGLAKVTYDPTTGTSQTNNSFVKGLPNSGPDSLIFDHQGRMVVSNSDVGTLSLVDPATGVILTSQINTTRISVPADMALDPSSNTVAVISWQSPNLYLVNLDTGQTTQINPDPNHVGNFGGVTYNGDGTRLFLASHSGWIYELDPHTGALIREIQTPGGPDGMTFDPTTNHIYASNCGGICDIYIGTDAQPTLALIKVYTSRDGDGIAADGQGHLFIISADLYRLDLATDTVTRIANAGPTWDDVAPVIGSGAANQPPVAQDQTVSTNQDTPLAITLAATDPEGDTLTYGVVANPSHGSLSGTAPNLTYTPDSGYTGPDSFTFKANDGQSDSNVATVGITVEQAASPNQPPVLGTLSDQTVDFNDALTVTVSATDPDHDPLTLGVTGLPHSLTFRDNGDGTGVVSGTVTDHPGSFTVDVTADDGHGHTVTSSLKLTVAKEDASLVYTGSVTGDSQDAVTVSATLIDPNDQSPIAGKPVTFTLNNAETCQATTTSDGSASCSLTPQEAGGSYPLAVSFAGDQDYLAASASAMFTVTPEQTSLAITSSNTLAAGSVTVAAQLLEDTTGPAIAGRTITFTATPNGGGTAVTGTGKTDSSGNASVSLKLGVGDYTLAASFAGDADYLASAATNQAHLYVYQPTHFVIWGGNPPGTSANPNVTVGLDYTFWGAQWSRQVTGGAYQGTSSFKGYADGFSSDGQSWTARPGNSSKPPTSVPTYIGVIVATKITKSGSTISGDVAEVVVLKVDDPNAYAPNPGHSGTGVLVAAVH